MKKVIIALVLILSLCKPLQVYASPPIDKYAIVEQLTLQGDTQLYTVNQDYRQKGEAGYGYLTLWLEIDNKLHPVEEHIENGKTVRQIGQLVEYNGNTFIKFYFVKVDNPDRGYQHTIRFYYLNTTY